MRIRAFLVGWLVGTAHGMQATLAEAEELVALAAQKGLHLGCSPISFWGEAQQTVAHQLMASASAAPAAPASAPWASPTVLSQPPVSTSTIGTVRTVTADVLCGSWEPQGMRLGGWKEHRRFGIGSLRDVAVYPFSLMTAFFGPATYVVLCRMDCLALHLAACTAAHTTLKAPFQLNSPNAYYLTS